MICAGILLPACLPACTLPVPAGKDARPRAVGWYIRGSLRRPPARDPGWLHPAVKPVKHVTIMQAGHKLFSVRTDQLLADAAQGSGKPSKASKASSSSSSKKAPWSGDVCVAALKHYFDQHPNPPLYVMMDNDPSHTSAAVSHFFATTTSKRLLLPPYSPDLSPCDYGLYGPLNKKQREWLFSNPEAGAEEFDANYTGLLQQAECTAIMHDWHRRLKACRDSGGEAVE